MSKLAEAASILKGSSRRAGLGSSLG